jgi:nephrocystin-3
MSDANLLGRQIRVFISSTFRDMQADRDVLVKKVFPQLRKLCESRAVSWTEVDLRWGITSEQEAEGKVLPYCLAEIERSRPFFIGLLGERYGWVPQSIPAELMEQQPWLREHLQHSVTELEILHGVLNNPAMAERALFYFRDPAYAAAAPAEQRGDFVENGPDAAPMQQKLTILKDCIRTAAEKKKLKYPPRENYADPEALGDLILADLTQIIGELYPPDQVPDPLDQEAARHEAYARSRRLAFVGREDILSRLDEYTAAPRQPVVLIGQSGCGKSALLAEWASRWHEKHPDDLVLQHYIGSTPGSADWQELVRRIVGELKRAFAIAKDIPGEAGALRNALREWTAKAIDSRRIVLVLDALNQIVDDGVARQLGWLPVEFPANFRVLVSAVEGASLDESRRRGWPELNVLVFAQADIAPASEAYFTIFGKRPSKDILAKLESSSAACNALYLRAVLDELRQFGKYEELDAKATEYLSSSDAEKLYERILVRWEQDFGEDLVRDSLSLIWAARRGLSESELSDLLGAVGEPLPRAKWTPLYLAAEFSLAQQAGLLNFSHSYVRDAVENRYMQSEEIRRLKHQVLATYFKQQKEINPRKLNELPWQCAKAALFDDLQNALTDVDVFLGLSDLNRHEIWNYWQGMPPERQSFVYAYNNSLEEWKKALGESARFELALNELEHFYLISGEKQESVRLTHLSYELAKQLYPEDDIRLAIRTNNLANALFEEGKPSEALPLGLKAQPVYEREFTVHQIDRWTVPANIGFYLFHLGRFVEAEEKLRAVLDAERMYLGARHHSTLTTLLNLATVVECLGRFSEATPLFEEAASGSKATVGEDHPATRAKLEHLRIHLADFVNTDSTTALTNLARHLEVRGIKSEAMKRYHEALGALEGNASPNDARIAMCLSHLAVLLKDCGDHAGFQTYLVKLMDNVERSRKALETSRSGGENYQPMFAVDLSNQARRIRKLGHADEAASLLRLSVTIEDLLLSSDHPNRAHRRNNLAITYLAGGQVQQAIATNAAAWRFKAGQHDLTSGRILFARVALCWLCHADATLYLGQLKTLLAQSELPRLGEVARKWDATDVVEHLAAKLPAEGSKFLSALLEVLDDFTKLPDLDRFEQWRAAAAVPLDAPWPETPPVPL